MKQANKSRRQIVAPKPFRKRSAAHFGEWPTMGEALHNLNEIESAIVHEGRMFEDELYKQLGRRKG